MTKLDTTITNTAIIYLMNGAQKVGRITNSFSHHCFLLTNKLYSRYFDISIKR